MLSIIIVNYLQKDLLAKCVGSIYKNLPGSQFELVVVNNSPEEDLSGLASAYSGLKIISNENKGYSNANNLGAKHSNGEYLLFLNADTEVLSDFTGDILNCFSGNNNYGAVGLGLQYPGGGFQNSFGLFPTIINEYKNRRIEIAFRKKLSELTKQREKNYSAIKEVDWVSGAAIFIRKDVFNAAGGFDERFFLYYEDIDLCYRLNKAGYKNYYYPFTKITHHKGENTRKEISLKLRKIQQTSQKLYYRLHNSLADRILLNAIQLLR